jgi:hypothetical protein
MHWTERDAFKMACKHVDEAWEILHWMLTGTDDEPGMAPGPERDRVHELAGVLGITVADMYRFRGEMKA